MEENELREPDQTTEEKNLESETEILSQKTETETAPQKPESEIKELRESLRLRKSTYMKQQVEKQRAAEDLLTDQIMAEQKILDEILDSIDDNIERTEESRKYNKEVQDEINARIYAMHGITEDKMQGMRESKNAYYRGCAFSLFLLSVVLILLCGFLHGFSAEITLFMLAYTGLEGALLSKDEKRSRWLAILCRVLYLFIFPAMMVMFVCYELGYPEYEQFLPYMQSVSVVPVGLTKFRDGLYPLKPLTKEDMEDTIDRIERWQRHFYETFGTHFIHASDEFYLMTGRELPEEARYDGYLQLENGVGMMRLLELEVQEALSDRTMLRSWTENEKKRIVSIATGQRSC